MKWVFFGSSQFSIYVLNELKLHGLLPDLVVTMPDMPKGRKLVVTSNLVKVWAMENKIEVIENLNELSGEWDLFLVASYGKIIKPEIFNLPKRKTLNIHPSLLPKYRGASPIISQIINDEKEVGVSIMQIEEGMDAGPVVVQRKVEIENWPISAPELEEKLAREGARLFAHVLPEWLSGAIDPIMQNEDKATYCKKIKKEDGLLDLENDPRKNLLKIKAYQGWPTTYFFLGEKRIIITDAKLEEGKLKILRVIPEGKKEMNYDDFLRGNR